MSKGQPFRVTTARDARSLTDGVALHTPTTSRKDSVVMPWMGFGTYRLGKDVADEATYQALKAGYRSIDTAFIYGGETTERLVGNTIKKSLSDGTLPSRNDLFLTTKHWRKYHGYEPTKQCLKLSLKRLQLDYIDLWLMHWPGPAYSTMNRRKEVEKDRWHYATTSKEDMKSVRAETWRAMEDLCREGLTRAIGVSNMSVDQLKALKKTATIWPPAVNQVELHPLHPQTELLGFCRAEGIIVEAYASLGGQDTGKAAWGRILGKRSLKSEEPLKLLTSQPVLDLAGELKASPAQVLLRYGLERNCIVIPKTTCTQRLEENAKAMCIDLSGKQADKLETELRDMARACNPNEDVDKVTRLCWRSDPLRHLDFP